MPARKRPFEPAVALAHVADRLRRQIGWRRDAIAVLCGALSILAMAPFHLSPILALTLPALVWMIDGATVRSNAEPAWRIALRGARIGWMFGVGYHLPGLFWVAEAFLVEADVFAWLIPFAVTLLPSGLAAFHAVALAIATLAWRPGVERVLVLALALSASEFLRGTIFTGFPWNILGYALTYPLVLMQSAGVVGIYGLTFITVLIFAVPLVVVHERPRNMTSGRPTFALLGVAGLLTAMVFYGVARLMAPVPAPVAGVKLRIVQPSIPQRDKWRPERQREFFDLHLALSGQRRDGTIDDLAGVTHVIWPEASMPFQPLLYPTILQAIDDRLQPSGAVLIAGALRSEPVGDASTSPPRRRAFNSVLVLEPGRGLTAIYDKIHLVPFGEYLPFQATLESIGLEQLTRQRGGFNTGVAPRQLMRIASLPPVSMLICYEAIFPAAVVQTRERPGVIVNVTNDGWFGHTTGPYQHLHQNRVRAVEEGVALIRSGNNGVSAAFDPHGRELGRIGLDVRGTLDTVLPSPLSPPLYAWTGNWLFLAVWMTSAAWIVSQRLRRGELRAGM